MNIKSIILSVAVIFCLNLANAQYKIKDEIDIACSSVKDQQRTGTCWSFATTSFLESELIRMGKDEVDLSEMFNVRMVYFDKAQNYVLRQGEANFSQGSLAHDVIKTLDKFGVVPESAYSGLTGGDKKYNHGELSNSLKSFLDGVIKSKKPSKHWPKAFSGILDAYMGGLPETFEHDGKQYTSKSFAEEMGLNAGDYLTFTSFTHHPFHEEFILEIPDNYSNGIYFNVKLNELVEIINYALENGYTISWDGDVGERGFSQKKGLAIIPGKTKKGDLFEEYINEIDATQELRQESFMDYSTTDDHLMHLVGRAKDESGNIYYKIKNSWGEEGVHEGYLYMSETYFMMKTVGITLHKGGVPKDILKKMN